MDQWFSSDQGLPSWNNSSRATTSYGNTRNISSLKLTANDLGPLNLNTSSFFDYTYQVEDYNDAEGQVGLGKQHNHYTTNRFGGHSVVDWHTDWNTLTGMVDAQRETYDPEDLLNPKNRMRELPQLAVRRLAGCSQAFPGKTDHHSSPSVHFHRGRASGRRR